MSERLETWALRLEQADGIDSIQRRIYASMFDRAMLN
jgi:hypothetical protein